MPADKETIVDAYRRAQRQAEELVASVPQSAWSRGAYEHVWNAKQLLCHIADSCNVARFLIGLAKDPRPRPAGGDGGAFDIDKWNAQQVAMREGKSIQELLAELQVNIGRFPGETSCLSLCWAVLDLVIAGARGLGLSDLDHRELQRLRFKRQNDQTEAALTAQNGINRRDCPPAFTAVQGRHPVTGVAIVR